MARIIILLLTIGIQLYALFDCAQREDGTVRNLPRWGWLLIIILVSAIGALAYLIAGRPKGPGKGKPKRNRTIAPDDDPDFLRGL